MNTSNTEQPDDDLLVAAIKRVHAERAAQAERDED